MKTKRVKANNTIGGLGSEAGQAVVEYVLVMSIVVAVLLGTVYQFNDAFRNWADSYFGDYVACLLETGELPGLGAQTANGICQQVFQEFSLADGRPLKGAGIGESGAAAGSTRTGRSSSSSSSTRPAASIRSRSFSNAGARSRFRVGRRPSRASVGGQSVSDNDKDSRDGTTNIGRIRQQQSESGLINRQKIKGSSYGLVDKDKKEKKPVRKSKKAKAREKAKRNAYVKVAPPPTAKAVAPEIKEMGFGGFLRYLIIAAIIIALVILLGGQALQIGKSME